MSLMHAHAAEEELLDCLIDDERGRDPLEDAASSAAHQRDKDGWTPLHWAGQEGHERLAGKLLALQVSINAADHCGASPLMIASYNGHAGVVDTLLQKGSCDVEQGNNYLSTAAHYASQQGHALVLRLLINARAIVDATDRHGDTPLGHAAKGGHIDAVKILCEMQADPLQDNNASEDALELAAAAGHIDIVEMLEATVGDPELTKMSV